MRKCKFPNNEEISIMGIPLDPCRYEVIEKFKNVTVEVRRCVKCGNIDVAWIKQDDTERVDVDG